eukprot:6210276-Pleurochrysis_carterae.AAC.3
MGIRNILSQHVLQPVAGALSCIQLGPKQDESCFIVTGAVVEILNRSSNGETIAVAARRRSVAGLFMRRRKRNIDSVVPDTAPNILTRSFIGPRVLLASTQQGNLRAHLQLTRSHITSTHGKQNLAVATNGRRGVLRGDVSRRDHCHLDTLVRYFSAKRVIVADERCFGRGVGRAVRLAEEALHRRDDRDRTAAAREHRRQQRTRQGHMALELGHDPAKRDTQRSSRKQTPESMIIAVTSTPHAKMPGALSTRCTDRSTSMKAAKESATCVVETASKGMSALRCASTRLAPRLACSFALVCAAALRCATPAQQMSTLTCISPSIASASAALSSSAAASSHRSSGSTAGCMKRTWEWRRLKRV